MRKKGLLLAALAIFLVVELPVKGVSGPFLSAEPVMRITDLAVPKELGKITGRFAGTSDRWIILIQDIHAHLTAQENISALVDHLNQIYGIETFGLEGGWSKSKLIKSNRLPNSQAKQQLARALLEDAYLTGPAYSGLFSPKPLKLVGLESKKLYLRNREAFLELHESQDSAAVKLSAVEKQLDIRKTGIYSSELLEFDRALTDFREGRNPATFLPYLLSVAVKLEIEIFDLDQISLFREIIKAEKGIDTKKLESEAQRLMKLSPDPRLSFEEILRSGQIAEPQLAHYPEAVKFKGFLELSDALSHHAFFDQIDLVIHRVKRKLLRAPEEKELDAQWERFLLAKKMITLQAVPADIKRAAEEIEAVRRDMTRAGLSEFLGRGIRFYVYAKKRDARFFESIRKQPLLAGNIAVVAGGFHTEGITTRLEREGISYIILTPSLGEEAAPADEKLYAERMAENLFQPRADTETLAPFAFFLRSIFDKKAFEEGVKSVERSRNVNEGKKTVLEWMVRQSSGARPGKTAPAALSIETFLSQSPEQQRSRVEKWLDEIRQTRIPVAVGIRTSTLRELLKADTGWTYWKNYMVPDRFLTLGEFQDTEDFLVEPFIGMRKQPLRIKLPEDHIVGQMEIARLRRDKETDIALIGTGFPEGKKLLVLPPRPASFMAARLLLENKITGKISEDFLGRLDSLLTEIFSAQGVLEKSA